MTTVRPLKLCVPSALGVLFATLFVGAAAMADTLSVPDEYATIQSAIDASTGGDVIEIAAGTYQERLTITDVTVTIRAKAAADGAKGDYESVIIDATQSGRLLYITGNNKQVSLIGLTLTNGSGSSGAGVFVSQASLVLTDCSISSNVSSGSGGGVYLSNTSSLSASGTTFQSNQASTGGGLFADSACPVTLTSCVFDDNTAQNSGGAVFLVSASHTLSATTFSGNRSPQGGSGAGLYLSGGTLALNTCVFTGNGDLKGQFNGSYGGACYVTNDAAMTSVGSVFTNNRADYGGAFYSDSTGTQSFLGGSFDSNDAEYGGALYVEFGEAFSMNTVAVDSNSSVYGGGGLYLECNQIELTSVQVTNNQVDDGYGAGIQVYGGVADLVGCTFEGNTLNAGDFNGINSSERGGGAYLDVNSKSTVTSCVFRSNVSSRGGGLSLTQGTVIGCTFEDNTAWNNGGGVQASGSVQFELCTFDGNRCDLQDNNESYPGGGGAWVSGGGGFVDCVFRDNEVLIGQNTNNYTYTGGGGLYVYGSTSKAISNCTFEDNSVRCDAANYDPYISGGGGVYVYQASSLILSGTTSFTGNEFISNSSYPERSGGGAFYNYESTVSFTDTDFNSNACRLTCDGGTYFEMYETGGGAVYGYYSSTTSLESCSFSLNEYVSTEHDDVYRCGGGAVFALHQVTAIDTTFASNRAVKEQAVAPYDLCGGAVWIRPQSGSSFTQCSFTDNEADDRGGAVYSDDYNNLNIDNCTLTGNACSNEGGAIYGNNTVYVSGSSFCDNAPGNWGGNVSDQGSNDLAGHCEGSDFVVNVPSEYPTIAQGVRHALDGDTVEVAAGTYTDSVDLGSRDISVIGVDGPDVTIIDLGGENRRGFYAPLSTGIGTISGFTVRNAQSDDLRGGLGVYAAGDMTISNCVFDNLTLTPENYGSDAGGAAVFSTGNLLIASCCFTNCDVALTSSVNYVRLGGGAIYNETGSLDIQGCDFTSCTWDAGSGYSNSDSGGGAIYMTGGDQLQIAGSTFLECHAIPNPGKTIYAEGGAVYVRSASPIQFDTSTFTLCTAVRSGGAISVPGGSFSVSSCDFLQCSVSYDDGGALWGQQGMNLFDSTFTGCSSLRDGGAVFSNNVATVDGCTFDQNTSLSRGGGFYCTEPATLTNSTFTNNLIVSTSSDRFGAAAYLSNNNNLIEDCSFSGNQILISSDGASRSYIGGAALYINDNATIRRTDFQGNKVVIDITGGSESALSECGGGSIYSRNNDLFIEDSCSFTGDELVITGAMQINNVGGASIFSRSSGDDYSFIVSDAVFNSNQVRIEADLYGSPEYIGGGAIFDRFGYPDNPLQITNSQFDGNSVLMPSDSYTYVGGGALFARHTVVSGGSFTNNFTDSSDTGIDQTLDGGAILSMEDLACDDVLFSGNNCGGDGGALFSASGTTAVTNSVFTGNGAYQGPSGAIAFSQNGSVSGSTACSNAPTNFGGFSIDESVNDISQRCDGDTPVLVVPDEYPSLADAVRFAFDGDTIEIGPGVWNDGIEFLGRDLSLRGVSGAEATIINAAGLGRPAIVADRADGVGTIEGITVTGASVVGGAGGGMRIAGSMTIKDCIVRGNILEDGTGGAGIACTGGFVTLENVLIENNAAVDTIGGGLWVDGGGVDIQGGSIVGNSASNGGGAYFRFADSVVDGVLFDSNVAVSSGGNLYSSGSLTLSNTVLSSGTASQGGGAYFSNSSATLSDVVVTDSVATGLGGGILVSGGTFSSLRDTYTNNASGNSGGGLYLSSAQSVISEASFIGNTAASNGGGYALNFPYQPIIQGCLFESNQAVGSGGGLHLYEVEGENGAQINGCSLLGNSSGLSGGGLRISETPTKVTIVDCSIAGNTSDTGAGISNYRNRLLTLQEVNLYNNHADLFGGGLYDEGSAGNFGETVINECVVSGNTASLVGGGIYLLLTEMAISNTDFCANEPGQIVGFWSDYGNNTFGEIACYSDCDGNGVEDSLEVVEGVLEDCDGNGIPDICEIADGTAEDCDGDGRLDSCTKGGFVSFTSSTMPAVGYGAPQQLVLDDPPAIASGYVVAIDVEALGDFSSPLETLTLSMNGTPLTEFFQNGLDCITESSSLNIPGAQFEEAASSGSVVFELSASIAVDASFCTEGMSRITVSYVSGINEDCNGNGLLDSCEIAAGYVSDCDGNGVPDTCDLENGFSDCNSNGLHDSCEIFDGTVTDCDFNGVPDSCDLAAGVSDCNENGLHDACEIGSGSLTDCDGNGVPDSCQILSGVGDCDLSGVLDVCEITRGELADLNGNMIPDLCECTSDLNGDFSVNGADLATLLADWTSVADGVTRASDVNGDGLVNGIDLATLLADWGDCF